MATEFTAARMDLRLAPSELAWFQALARARKETLSQTVRSVMAAEAQRFGIPGHLLTR